MKKIVTILIVALMTVAGAFAQPAEHTYRNLTEGDVARLLDDLYSYNFETSEATYTAYPVHWYGQIFIYNDDTAFFEKPKDNEYYADDYQVLDSFRIYDSDCLATVVYGLYWTSETEARYMLSLYVPGGCLERTWSISVDDMSKVLNYLTYADLIKATDKSDNPDVRDYIELCRNSVGL